MAQPRKKGDKVSVHPSLEDAMAAADDQLAAAMVRLRGRTDRVVLSTGHPCGDYVLGSEPPSTTFPKGKLGGLVLGTNIEIYGPESSAKSYWAMLAVIAALAANPWLRAAWVDAERSMTESWFVLNGGGPYLDRFVVFEPDSGEHGLDLIARIAQKKLADIVVVDSVAALVPEMETIDSILNPKVKAEMGGGRLGEHARLMSKALRALVPVCGNNNVCVVWINQTRVGFKKTMAGHVAVEVTTGGNALKFYSSIRLSVRKIKLVTAQVKNPFTGQLVNETRAIQSVVRCVKNKIGVPDREAILTFALRRGYDLEYDALVCAVANGWIAKSGSWYELGEFAKLAECEKVQGLVDVYALIRKFSDFRTALLTRVIDIATKAEKATGDMPMPAGVGSIGAPPTASDDYSSLNPETGEIVDTSQEEPPPE